MAAASAATSCAAAKSISHEASHDTQQQQQQEGSHASKAGSSPRASNLAATAESPQTAPRGPPLALSPQSLREALPIAKLRGLPAASLRAGNLPMGQCDQKNVPQKTVRQNDADSTSLQSNSASRSTSDASGHAQASDTSHESQVGKDGVAGTALHAKPSQSQVARKIKLEASGSSARIEEHGSRGSAGGKPAAKRLKLQKQAAGRSDRAAAAAVAPAASPFAASETAHARPDAKPSLGRKQKDESSCSAGPRRSSSGKTEKRKEEEQVRHAADKMISDAMQMSLPTPRSGSSSDDETPLGQKFRKPAHQGLKQRGTTSGNAEADESSRGSLHSAPSGSKQDSETLPAAHSFETSKGVDIDPVAFPESAKGAVRPVKLSKSQVGAERGPPTRPHAGSAVSERKSAGGSMVVKAKPAPSVSTNLKVCTSANGTLATNPANPTPDGGSQPTAESAATASTAAKLGPGASALNPTPAPAVAKGRSAPIAAPTAASLATSAAAAAEHAADPAGNKGQSAPTANPSAGPIAQPTAAQMEPSAAAPRPAKAPAVGGRRVAPIARPAAVPRKQKAARQMAAAAASSSITTSAGAQPKKQPGMIGFHHHHHHLHALSELDHLHAVSCLLLALTNAS